MSHKTQKSVSDSSKKTQESSKFFGAELGNSKADVMGALKTHVDSLISIELPQPMTPISQALKDFRRERVLFNDIPFIPHKSGAHRNFAFALSLKEFIRRIRRSYPGCDKSCSVDSSVGTVDTGEDFHFRPEPRESDLLDLENMSSCDLILQRACR